jgi:hypothetical protein
MFVMETIYEWTRKYYRSIRKLYIRGFWVITPVDNRNSDCKGCYGYVSGYVKYNTEFSSRLVCILACGSEERCQLIENILG